jgi:hypothetical protein
MPRDARNLQNKQNVPVISRNSGLVLIMLHSGVVLCCPCKDMYAQPGIVLIVKS